MQFATVQQREGCTDAVSQKTCHLNDYFRSFRVKGCRCEVLAYTPSCVSCILNSFLTTLKTYCFFTASALLLSFGGAAQKHDTLQTVRLISKKEINIAATTVPLQVLDKEKLERLNSISVADAVKYFAGVTVKDYGGIGGLKTISVRSLGANHTGVIYDGLLLGDAQGGQIDLGKFSLDNIREIQLYTGGITDILSPARAFASASLLSLKTSSCVFDNTETASLNIGLKQGSFGYLSPTASAKLNLSKKIQMSLNGFYEYAKGNYPFLSYEGNGQKDKRNNSDINASRIEYNAAFKVNDSSKVLFKAFYYSSKRGLPGAVIYYNTTANQRLNDEDLFLQSSWQYDVSKKGRLLLGAKFSNNISNYRDPSYPNSYGKLVNDFHQQELYFSAGYKYDLTKTLAVSFSSDAFNNKLKRTDIFAGSFADPSRNSFLNNIALQLKKNYFEAGGNLLYSVLREKAMNGPAGKDRDEFTGGVSASLQPAKNIPLRFRGSYQHIFRAPTFNDLYYTNVGNTNLRPEYANQYDLGLTLDAHPDCILSGLIFTGDAYLNHVKDKILAVPRQNLFQWSEQNIGIVQAKGIDAAVHLRFKDLGQFRFSADLSYSFQQARDISDKNSPLYKTQLPNTPKHSGSADIGIGYKDLSLGFNMISSSYRYRAGDPIPENVVQGWSTNDISFLWLFKKAHAAEYKFTAEANNIFNIQYQVIKYYPMPRFNYRVGVIASFKKINKTTIK